MTKILVPSLQIVSNGSARVKCLAFLHAALCTGVALVTLVTLLAGRATAAPFDPMGGDWEGYVDFVRLMRAEAGDRHVIVTNRIDWGTLNGEDSLILVYPDHSIAMTSAGAFVRAGGRLALLDDFGRGDALLDSFDIQRVPLPDRPRLALRDNPNLAIAEPGPDEHPLTQGVDRVVTNHASGVFQPLLNTILRVRGDDGRDVPVALAASIEKGRLLVVGDPSIAMNSMLRYAGNRAFAKNLVQYLTAGHGAGSLYLVVTQFAESGSFAGAGTRASAWHDALDQARASLGREGLPSEAMYWLALVLAVAVMMWIVPRTARTYQSRPPRFTRPIPLVVQGGAAGHAAAVGAKEAYRGHAMLEWQRAFVDDLAGHFNLPRDVATSEIVKRVARLGVVDAKAIRGLERVLLRMAEIDTMLATKQRHALGRIKDDEVIAAGKLVGEVLLAVHGERPLA